MQNKIKIPYWPDEPNSKPLPKQLEAHQANYRFRMLSGAVRAGKSVWGCQEGIKLSFKFPGNTGAIVRNTLTELKRTTQITFFKMFDCFADNASHPLIKTWNKSEQHLRFINDSDIYFIGIENWSVLKSLELGWVFVDEGVEVKSSALKFLRTRLNKKISIPGYSQYFLTATNPGDEEHILYKWFIKIPENEAEKEARKKFWCDYTVSYDNIYLPDEYKNELESLKSDKEFYDRYVLGKWGRFKGLVYSEFDEAVHLVDESQYKEYMLRIKEFYCGVDWGYTNPACILFFGVTGDDEVILIDEIYEAQKTNPELRQLYNDKITKYDIEPRKVYCDPAEPSDIKEFQDNGIPAIKGNNDIEVGIRKVKEFLRVGGNGKPRFKIFERCINTRKEFRLYRRPNDEEVNQNKNIPELPIDKNNHAMGCLRYFKLTHFLGSSTLQYDESLDFDEEPSKLRSIMLKRRKKSEKNN